jgi:hypothetical protein
MFAPGVVQLFNYARHAGQYELHERPTLVFHTEQQVDFLELAVGQVFSLVENQV